MSIDRYTLKFNGWWVPRVRQNLVEVFLDGRLMDIPSNSIMYFFIVFRNWGWADESFRASGKKGALCSRLIVAIVDERSEESYDPIWKVAVTTYRTPPNSRGEYII